MLEGARGDQEEDLVLKREGADEIKSARLQRARTAARRGGTHGGSIFMIKFEPGVSSTRSEPNFSLTFSF